jgi:hypothetical protein
MDLRMDPAEGAVVQELFARYVDEGATLGRVVAALGRVVAALEQQGIPSPHERRLWSRSTLRWMLSHPVYRGQVYANRTRARAARQRHSPLQPVGRSSPLASRARRSN